MKEVKKIVSESIEEVLGKDAISVKIGDFDLAKREKVVDSLSNFIIRVANKKRPTKTELRVLPEVVNSLNHFNRL